MKLSSKDAEIIELGLRQRMHPFIASNATISLMDAASKTVFATFPTKFIPLGWGDDLHNQQIHGCYAYNLKLHKWSLDYDIIRNDDLDTFYVLLVPAGKGCKTLVGDLFPNVGSCWFYCHTIGEGEEDAYPIMITDLKVFHDNLEGWAKSGCRYSNNPDLPFSEATPFKY